MHHNIPTVKEKRSYAKGLEHEKIALDLLRKKYTIEDRSNWAQWGSGKEYAMDWLIEDFNVAVEYKFKTINPAFKTITINDDHITKYIKYLDNNQEIARGFFWIQDNVTLEEYRIDMRDIERLIKEGTIIKRTNNTTRKAHESGGYYAIPLKYFDNITDKPYSITSCSRL